MVDIPPPRMFAEAQFKSASAEAALFELRMRMLAATIPQVCDEPIDIKLSLVRDAILARYKPVLTADDNNILMKACTIRNKLLHCEFSSARKQLDQLDQKSRGGDVSKIDISGLSGNELCAKIVGAISGANVGQVLVGGTKTKTLKDIFGWLLECQVANEFKEARATFCEATDILNRLAVVA